MNLIGSDHAGFKLKEAMLKKFSLKDTGCFSNESCHYPQIVQTLTSSLQEGDKAIIICGSGVGVQVVANKVKGVLCAHVQDSYNAKIVAEMGCNVITIGERMIGEKMASEIIKVFLETSIQNDKYKEIVTNWEKLNFK